MNRETRLDRPIVVLGAARSGTTLVADMLLSKHPDVAYWSEPNYVWRHGHAYRRDDVLVAADATEPIRSYIRGRFAEHLERAGRSRFMEKTPSNCLRVPFVHRVLPEAKIVHVLRDGRDVARSAAKEWSGRGVPRDAEGARPTPHGVPMLRRIVGNELRLGDRVRDLRGLAELPAYAGRLVDLVRRHVFHASEVPWGPRLPGLGALRRRFSLLQTCALQWETCVRMARSACAQLPPEHVLEIRYEELVAHPRESLSRILRFVELDAAGDLLDTMAATVRPPRQVWSNALDDDEHRDILAVVGSTLSDLGYGVERTA